VLKEKKERNVFTMYTSLCIQQRYNYTQFTAGWAGKAASHGLESFIAQCQKSERRAALTDWMFRVLQHPG